MKDSMEPRKSPSSCEYIAKEDYKQGQTLDDYVENRFSGLLGGYRFKREQRAVIELVDTLPADQTIVDCPCGTGRWWPVLARRAKRIIALDISPGMLRTAQDEATRMSLDVEVRQGDAERIPLEDGSVDYTFSFALTKHLPLPVQYQVLSEFSRISRKGVLSSFSVFSHLTYEFWRRRNLTESFGILPEQLEWMATAAGLKIEVMRKCTTPLGVERFVLFSKV
jgi:ubiquinone/menaquinone biosynthesis C-methylase UbiE